MFEIYAWGALVMGYFLAPVLKDCVKSYPYWKLQHPWTLWAAMGVMMIGWPLLMMMFVCFMCKKCIKKFSK